MSDARKTDNQPNIIASKIFAINRPNSSKPASASPPQGFIYQCVSALTTAAVVLFAGTAGAQGYLVVSGDSNLLTALGSSMSIVQDSIDPGFNISSNIDADPLTSGVSSFRYAATSEVAGGTSLIRTLNGTTFIAYEKIPAPGTLAAMAGLVAVARRRRA